MCFAPQRRATFHLSSPQMSPRRFSEPTFQPSGATKPRKNTVFRDFPTFSRTCIFFLLIFSLLTLLPAHCFFISPYCRKFDFQTSFDHVLYHVFIMFYGVLSMINRCLRRQPWRRLHPRQRLRVRCRQRAKA